MKCLDFYKKGLLINYNNSSYLEITESVKRLITIIYYFLIKITENFKYLTSVRFFDFVQADVPHYAFLR